jgi:hypothetical protein
MCARAGDTKFLGIVKSVYVLGAGFSRAVSENMPLTDELGTACLQVDPALAASAPNNRFQSGGFEAWLSRLAEDQPYLRLSENLAARSVYTRAIEIITKLLSDREEEAVAAPCPSWLLELVELWHRERATVITFNYDTLIETAVKDAALYDEGSNITVPWPTVVNFTPPGTFDVSYGEAGRNASWESFQLLKMHGSLNWFWTPGDESGATIARGKLPGRFGAPEPMSEAERQRWLPGREPLLVPPAALKTSFYSNPLMREIWHRAVGALRSADRVVLMGYSLPATDLSTSGLFAEALGSREGVDIEVLDLRPELIVDRLEALLGRAGVGGWGGPTAIEESVSRWQSTALAAALDQIKVAASTAGDLPVAVSWNQGAIAAAVGARRVGHTCVVDLEGIGQIWFATRSNRQERAEIVGHTTTPPLRASALMSALDGCSRIVVRTDFGAELRVLGAYRRDFTGVNSGQGEWFLLVPSGIAMHEHIT